MLAGLVVAGLVALTYFFAKGTAEADAPCHCGAQTIMGGQKLSYSDLLTLAQNAGFDCDAGVAAAIALAESGGDAGAYNPEKQACTPCGEGSYGLWQIYRKAHPDFACIDLNDPQTNANAAFTVYSQAGGFSPWSTYKSGAYQKFLQS